MRLTGNIEDGKLKLHDRKALEDFISKNEGEVWIDIKSAPKTRSPEQNGYYRVILRDVANQMGYTQDELHKIVKHKFKVETTKHLSVEEFTEFLDLSIRWFAELGFPVQDPRRSIFP
jgi:hypothetical protein